MRRLMHWCVPDAALRWGKLTRGRVYRVRCVRYPQEQILLLPSTFASVQIGDKVYVPQVETRWDQWAA